MTMIRAQQHVLMGPADGNGNGNGGGGNGGGAGGGAGGGGTGGAGGGAGGGGDGGGGEEIDPKIAAHITKTLNAALTNHSKRSEARLGEMLKTSLAEAMESMKPSGSGGSGGDGGAGSGGNGNAAGGGGQGGSGQGGSGGSGGGQDNALSLQVKKLQDQLDSAEKARKKEREESERERAERSKAEERSALTTALLKNGVPEARAAAASAMLFYDKGSVRRNDKGEICFVLQKVYSGEATEEVVPIDAGVSEWVKTNEGKEFLPPVDAAGSGGRGGKRPGPDGKKPPTAAEAATTVATAMMGAMWGQGNG